MADVEHRLLPFSELHKSRLAGGLFEDMPAAPEGIGDNYLATDTAEWYVCLDDSPLAWELYAAGGGGSSLYSGVRWYLDDPASITGNSDFNYLTWDSASYSYGGTYGTPGAFVLMPADGIYHFNLHLKLENTDAALWTVTVWSSDYDTLQIHTRQTDGSGDPVELMISGAFRPQIIQPDTGGWFLVDIAQTHTDPLNVLAGSYLTLNKAGDTP